jgi:hypothetical protein
MPLVIQGGVLRRNIEHCGCDYFLGSMSFRYKVIPHFAR